jgi:uncharacterized protein
MVLSLIVGIVLGILFIAWLVTTIWATNLVSNLFLTLREPSSLTAHPNVEGEIVDFQSEDGVRLKGKFIKSCSAPAKGTVIFCPEVDSPMDSCGKYTSFLPPHGYNVFSFDFRGHGASQNVEGYTPRQWVSSHELYDLFGALDRVKGLPGVEAERIFLFGVSRGAAAAICAAAINGNVRGIISDSAFSSKWLLKDYMYKWTSAISSFKRGPKFMYWVLEEAGVFVSEMRVQYRFPSVENALRTLKPPILMIHGQKDSYVSFRHAKKLYDTTRAIKQYLEVPNARHNEGVIVAPELYGNAVLEFLNSNGVNGSSTS